MIELLNHLGDIMWDVEKLVDEIEDVELITARRRSKEIKSQLYEFKKKLEVELTSKNTYIDRRGEGEDSVPFCQPCDIELEDDWNYCPNCGRQIASKLRGGD